MNPFELLKRWLEAAKKRKPKPLPMKDSKNAKHSVHF